MPYPFEAPPLATAFLGTIGIYAARNHECLGTDFGSLGLFGNIPNVIHQMDRSRPIMRGLLRVCPNLDPPIPDYLRIREAVSPKSQG
jgi:hypothetical protein